MVGEVSTDEHRGFDEAMSWRTQSGWQREPQDIQDRRSSGSTSSDGIPERRARWTTIPLQLALVLQISESELQTRVGSSHKTCKTRLSLGHRKNWPRCRQHETSTCLLWNTTRRSLPRSATSARRSVRHMYFSADHVVTSWPFYCTAPKVWAECLRHSPEGDFQKQV